MKNEMENRFNQFELCKLDMTFTIGGQGPAPSTMNTENVDWTGSWWQFQTHDVHGDSYPDDCCE